MNIINIYLLSFLSWCGGDVFIGSEGGSGVADDGRSQSNHERFCLVFSLDPTLTGDVIGEVKVRCCSCIFLIVSAVNFNGCIIIIILHVNVIIHIISYLLEYHL